MAELPRPKLIWTGELGDPAYRKAELPAALPWLGDDFDWDQRDFEGFRQAMWQELQTYFPERQRWSSGDLEAVLVELLAAQLDQLSDMADRVSAEASLESARRFESVLKWLSLIGYNPLKERGWDDADIERIKALYADKPHEMERDRQRGIASIRKQRRMASLIDYEQRLAAHPLVHRARANPWWNGSWWEIAIIVSLWEDWKLDDALETAGRVVPPRIRQELTAFTESNGLRKLELAKQPTIRELLQDYIRAFRMVGHVASLVDIDLIGVAIELVVTLKENYFQSEVRREVARALGRGPEGFFRSGRLTFGQDLRLSDIYGAVMPVAGVRHLQVARFGKVALNPQPGVVPDVIEMGPNEIPACDNTGNGYLALRLVGGRPG